MRVWCGGAGLVLAMMRMFVLAPWSIRLQLMKGAILSPNGGLRLVRDVLCGLVSGGRGTDSDSEEGVRKAAAIQAHMKKSDATAETDALLPCCQGALA